MAASAGVSLPKIPPAEFSAGTVYLRLGLPYPLLATAYHRWRRDGLFPLIFPRCPDIDLISFLDFCYRSTGEPIGVFIGDNLVGVGFIVQAWQIEDKVVAEVGAAFFRNTPLSVWHKALDLLMRHAFADRGFAAVYGVAAKVNRAGRLITRWCGMVEAERPDWLVEVPESVVYKLSREDWLMRCA
jgi:hypothetical protein